MQPVAPPVKKRSNLPLFAPPRNKPNPPIAPPPPSPLRYPSMGPGNHQATTTRGLNVTNSNPTPYGTGDSSFVAAGGEAGLIALVNDFYDVMETLPEATTILGMHPVDLTESRDKLSLFLSGWLNGPNTFRPKYGRVSIPQAHSHLPIGESEMEAWLRCMEIALSRQPYADDFKDYLLRQLRVPANRCRTR